MKTDRVLTKKIQEWLAKLEHTDREDIMSGALMMLQVNRNRALFNQITRNPLRFVDKIRYELGKFLPARLDDMTREDVIELNNEIMPPVAEAIEAEPEDNDNRPPEQIDLPLHKGIRADHDSLPPEIQRLWSDNIERWQRIKQLYETCRAIARPCERYTHLAALRDSWYKYKEAMNSYDDFVVQGPAVTSDDTADVVPADAATTARDINNARSYLSKNIDALLTLAQEGRNEDVTEKTRDNYSKLLSKVQKRVTLLVRNGQVIGDDIRGKLQPLGVVFE